MSAASDATGYRGLLNLEVQPHWTVFVSDFTLGTAEIYRLRRELETCATRPLFMRIDPGIEHLASDLEIAGVHAPRDYLSIHGVVFQSANVIIVDQLLERFPRGDLARVELPTLECGFRDSFATHQLNVVRHADYREQRWIADCFFEILSRSTPYHILVRTGGAALYINDRRPWFDSSGRLRQREKRILPGGEVAYTGDDVTGRFVADGAILPLPQSPDVSAEAVRLRKLSQELRKHPLRLDIRGGKVVDVSGTGKAAQTLMRMIDKEDRYRNVTEVGIAFNRACRRFIYGWPAASNEARPGVHLAIGGDPAPDGGYQDSKPLVHIDLIAANCDVSVNEHPFLTAMS